ncbi:class I SAM-dependent methyltransferase [Acidisphaera sp. L21]|jgi:SAM-dependent methyltransferase|uniref:class I SAM-dependent methyltransferase n=1 Tax=Acidisphaera sp. L21 TaxID=1641851 RepID=UPI00131DD023|nr:class I SAM-dependent methyltransferase [Acidisphaera sp. L21]
MSELKAPLTESDVDTAYRIFLGRPPEKAQTVANHLAKYKTKDEFRRAVVTAKEFYDRNIVEISRYVIATAPISSVKNIDVNVSGEDRAALFKHVHDVWSKLGATDPHFSVLSTPKYKPDNIAANQQEFYDSGRGELEVVFRRLESLGLAPASDGVALELGAGVGRVTRHLGDRFANVVGYDVSANHLALASSYVSEQAIANVEFRHLTSIDSASFPDHDFFYSRIVLQHNPPPIIAFLLDRVLARMNPNGVAVFQLMTARSGYTFDVKKYLSSMDQLDDQELHVLPQADVFRILRNRGLTCVEAARDSMLRGFDRTSMTFIAQKMG